MSSTLPVCQMKGCDGVLDMQDPIPLQSGCYSSSICYGCNKCGRVHSADGYLMFSKAGPAVYLKNGIVEWVDEPVEFIPGRIYVATRDLYLWDPENQTKLPCGTLLVFVSVGEAGFMFELVECHARYSLHRGDVNFIKEAAPSVGTGCLDVEELRKTGFVFDQADNETTKPDSFNLI